MYILLALQNLTIKKSSFGIRNFEWMRHKASKFFSITLASKKLHRKKSQATLIKSS